MVISILNLVSHASLARSSPSEESSALRKRSSLVMRWFQRFSSLTSKNFPSVLFFWFFFKNPNFYFLWKSFFIVFNLKPKKCWSYLVIFVKHEIMLKKRPNERAGKGRGPYQVPTAHNPQLSDLFKQAILAKAQPGFWLEFCVFSLYK